MIDADELKKVIKKGWDFRLGARGICINCIRRMVDPYDWCIFIPRAFTEIHAGDLKVVDDVDFYSLEVWHNEDMIADIDLSKYPVLTVLDNRMMKK